jgi:hypothetical protein
MRDPSTRLQLRPRHAGSAICALLILIPTIAQALNTKSPGNLSELRSELQALISSRSASIAVFVGQAESGATYSNDPHTLFPLRDGTKLIVVAEFYRQVALGQIDIDDNYVVTQRDVAIVREHVPFKPGDTFTHEELAQAAMLPQGGPTSTLLPDLLLRLVGPSKANALAQRFGFGQLATRGDLARQVYTQLAPQAAKMSDHAVRTLQLASKTPATTANILNRLLGEHGGPWDADDIERAHLVFRNSGINSGSAESLGRLLLSLKSPEDAEFANGPKVIEMLPICRAGTCKDARKRESRLHRSLQRVQPPSPLITGLGVPARRFDAGACEAAIVRDSAPAIVVTICRSGYSASQKERRTVEEEIGRIVAKHLLR